MQLTSKQAKGLDLSLKAYQNNDKYVVISGYAGVGKTTLVRFIIDAMGVDPASVCYCSYTGKATQILQEKGNQNSITLHHLIYKSIPLMNGKFLQVPREFIPYSVVVVDEVSIVPKTMMEILFSYPVFVICLGDPFQLPPINPKEDNKLLEHPNIFLDEIMRQAQESEIIRFTMAIRNKESISFFKGDEMIIMPKEGLTTNHLLWSDQIICATNNTRRAINEQVRKLLGYTDPYPQKGDKLICLKNSWDYVSDEDMALVNGTTGVLGDIESSSLILPRSCGYHSIDIVQGDFITSSGTYHQLTYEKDTFLNGGNSKIDNKMAYKASRDKKWDKSLPLQFDYGYAITGHKAQGSEWDKVLVLEEGFPFDKEEHARWLYTCATRAKEQIILVR